MDPLYAANRLNVNLGCGEINGPGHAPEPRAPLSPLDGLASQMETVGWQNRSLCLRRYPRATTVRNGQHRPSARHHDPPGSRLSHSLRVHPGQFFWEVGGPRRVGPRTRAVKPPGFHTTAREPKRAHFRVPSFKNTTKIQREDTQRERKRTKMGERKKLLGGLADK